MFDFLKALEDWAKLKLKLWKRSPMSFLKKEKFGGAVSEQTLVMRLMEKVRLSHGQF